MNTAINEKEIEAKALQVAEELAQQETALVAYSPKSAAPFKLDTLIPRNMAFEVQKALGRVIKNHGNIDHLVRNALKYASVETMWKGLAGEQVDSLALYVSQFERNQGIIIGDKTGIGKGRQAAGVIRHAVMNDYLPVFFTRKPDLFNDMYRDLKAIGFGDIHPFILNTDTNARIKDSEGHVVFSPLGSKEQYDELVIEREVATDSAEAKAWFKRIKQKLPNPSEIPIIKLSETIDYLPDGYDMVFCTYSQVQSAHHSKRDWIEKLVNKGLEGSKRYKKVVFVMDESHMAGGYDSIIGEWMRRVMPQTKSCCFLSATFAKYPEVMPLYAGKTAFSEAALKDDAFVSAMRKGGLALQEIVASNLAESGQLIRRQRSTEGIQVMYHRLNQEPERSKNRERVNRIIQIMTEIVLFEEEYVSPILTGIHKEIKDRGALMKEVPKSLGVKQSPYFSRVFNIVDQMLFALKVEEVARLALRLLAENKKVVIAFKSTMGAFLKDLNLGNNDVVRPKQMDFVRTLEKGLDSLFKYNFTDIDGKKSKMQIPLEELSAAGLKKYEAIKESIWDESTGLTISPIDELIERIEKGPKAKEIGGHEGSHYRVAEVTGRNQRVRLEKGQATVQSFRTDTEKFFRLFNSGDYDVLLINQSGSTGSSAHASVDFKDQRQRAMIIHQFELDINTEIQKRGRIDRTGQVVLPEYHYVTSDIPMEQRLMTMLKGKLKSLDANTTGSQKTNDDALRSPDFMNKYGDVVAFRWAGENRHMMSRLGWPTYHKEKEGYVRNENKDGAIRQLTGRAGLLSVEEQDQLYDDLLRRYEHLVNWEKQRGTYDLETEFLKLDAEIQKRFEYQPGSGGITPFGKDTVRDETIVNNLKRPMTKDELDEIIIETLGGKTPDQIQNQLVRDVEDFFPKLMEEERDRKKQGIAILEKELSEMPEEGSGEKDKENERILRLRERQQRLIDSRVGNLEFHLKELKTGEKEVLKFIRFWKIGDVLKVPMWGVEEESWGIFLGIDIGYGKNPYAPSQVTFKIAVADVRRIMEFNLSHEQSMELSSIFTSSKDITAEEVQMVHGDWNELVKSVSQKREKRQILTENIVGVADKISAYNKLIKYNTKAGAIKNGILLKRQKDGEEVPSFLPISAMLRTFKNLGIDDFFSDHQNQIPLKRSSPMDYQVRITKKGGRDLFTDVRLRELIERRKGQSEDELAEFIQNAGDMVAPLPLHHLEAFLERLDQLGLICLGVARELEDWEIENEEDWKNKNTKEGKYTYRLSRDYGQGSNPTIDFISYTEPNDEYAHGLVTYGRPLTDKERYNYSLIPVFDTVEEPYQAWKSYINQSPALKEELVEMVQKAKKMDVSKAILSLGFFIRNHPHEEGNPEFVFGQYDEADLGRMAYEDTIGSITALEAIIAQLKLELELA